MFIEVQEIMRDSHSTNFRRELKALEIDKTVELPSKNRQDRGTAIGHLVHLIVPIGEPNGGDLCRSPSQTNANLDAPINPVESNFKDKKNINLQ